MPTILTQLRSAFRAAILAAFNTDADPVLVPASNEKFGDYQCNAAMALAKQLKLKPREVAEKIRDSVDLGGAADKLEIAGPGFINIFLSSAWVENRLNAVASDPRLGVDRKGNPQTVVVDYSGPNIAKEMHVGHLRSTIIGDAASRVLEFLGDHVIRQNHLGDWGTQFGKVMLGLWYEATAKHTGSIEALDRWKQGLFELPRKPERETPVQQAERLAAEHRLLGMVLESHQVWLDADPDGSRIFRPYIRSSFPTLERLQWLYQLASALADLEAASSIVVRHERHRDISLAALPSLVATFVQQRHPEEIEAWQRAVDTTMSACGDIYQRLNVLLDRSHERGESSYSDSLPGVVDDLIASGHAKLSDGAVAIFLDGEEKPPLLIRKADGGFLYGTTDLAAIRYRVNELHANRIVYFTDSRQAQHFSQVFRAAKQAGWANDVSLEHAPFGTILGKDNKPFKTRSGDTVKLKDLLDEAEERAYPIVAEKNTELPDEQKRDVARAVGIGAVKYSDLSKDRTSDYVFDWDSALALTGNSAPYLQYAHARICAIFRKAGVPTSVGTSVSLEAPEEIALSKHILRLGEALDSVATELKPHILCAYLYDLATKFSAFYENCPVLKSDEPTRSSRLTLCAMTARTLALGLDLLGIKHPDQM